ncbi:tetratricopeptide repeat protein [Pseudotenacibaculum haliotis]|uniref:Tetratricopeptide repeat protein n=1 Tax=Pseudotenacibaculum haliotis TaxID=1862138 RepID=A0ABW5LUK8_9FLAO
MSTEDDILIERFLNDELSKKEHKAFLERMENDVEFKERVTLEKQLHESLDENSWSFLEEDDNPEVKEFEALLKSKESQKIKQSIAEAQADYQGSSKDDTGDEIALKKPPSQKKNLWLYTAATAVLIFFVVNVFMLKPKSNEELFSKYIQKTDLFALIDRGYVGNDSLLSKAQDYFDNKEYQKAADILTQVVDSSKNSNVYIYLAISQIELNEFDKAEKTLNKLILSRLLDAQKAYWFKSLLYLKTDQVEKSKKELQIIIDSSYFKSKDAKKLLKKLK